MKRVIVADEELHGKEHDRTENGATWRIRWPPCRWA